MLNSIQQNRFITANPKQNKPAFGSVKYEIIEHITSRNARVLSKDEFIKALKDEALPACLSRNTSLPPNTSSNRSHQIEALLRRFRRAIRPAVEAFTGEGKPELVIGLNKLSNNNYSLSMSAKGFGYTSTALGNLGPKHFKSINWTARDFASNISYKY